MNKEAELPKSIDFSQLPEAPRAFKAVEGHTHIGMGTHVCAHIYRHIYRQREKGLRVKG